MEPVFVSWAKFCLGEVANDCGHGHFTSAPRRTEVELEAVVLDILVASTALVASLAQIASDVHMLGRPHRLHLTP